MIKFHKEDTGFVSGIKRDLRDMSRRGMAAADVVTGVTALAVLLTMALMSL
jgi:hydroxymethylpyrimidine/phosphomethylpyrimidine kinase